MRQRALLLVACWSLIAPIGLLHAQSTMSCGSLQVSVSPDPAPYGRQIVLTLTNPGGTAYLPSSCAWFAVHQGSPTGPVVTGVGCSDTVTLLPPFASMSQAWNQEEDWGAQVAPGTYYFEVNHPIFTRPCFAPVQVASCPSGAFSSFGTGCGKGKCFTSGIDIGPLVLAPQTCPQIGTTFEVGLSHGDCVAPAALIMGASNTAWGALPLPLDLGSGCLLYVSPDVLFLGATSGYGKAVFPLAIPLDPALQGASAYLQGATLKDGVLKLSNAVAVVVG